MKNLLVVSCLKDDNYAHISIHLLKEKLADVKAGVEKKAAELQADVLYLLPEGEKVDGIDCEVRYGAYNPTLGNPYSVAQLLAGNLPRPMIQDDFVATYEDYEVSVMTPEEAYLLATGKNVRFVAVTADGKTEIKEVEIGTKAGSICDAGSAKAVLIGGQKGTFVKPESLADYEIRADRDDYAITVFNQDECMVQTAVSIMEQAWASSCGKCVLCREGTLQFKTIVTEMTTGKAKVTDLDLIREVGELIEIGAYCPFGRAMAKPLISAVNLFQDEFEEHIKRKTCKCGKCYKAAAVYLILPDLCTGCGDCVDECDEDAIDGKANFIHMIDQDMCEQCGKCVSACDEDAIVKWEDAKLPKLPKKLTKVGKF
ncbi:NADH-ubiquinone oxidoreductase-F iron-sulfur binding region domain-containing protein [Agathobacter ruminis]|uniref:4Fe-4S ferredoxin-type domain-containing protein n=1 Tax=Agathobacter ruminis TaxID=1712665 RepID=A0A2G3E5V5_9FIRM|nr:NADH-ubiquinone oxidoreductase-F iron-sulfur binding region domain-containing protein [Agathobacter ruminis]MDC7301073.1 4Fe-4S binding protein [Agathobacter ruminis]PHU38463.1 hypothetical protein CSX02_02695 [Agathobacter ruminis]